METAGKSTSKENNTLVLDNHLILLALNSHFQLNVACYPTATIIILYYNNITLTCQTQSKKRRKTGPCPLYLLVDKPTLTHRSANGWPPRSHSLSISPSNLYKITGNGQKSAPDTRKCSEMSTISPCFREDVTCKDSVAESPFFTGMIFYFVLI